MPSLFCTLPFRSIGLFWSTYNISSIPSTTPPPPHFQQTFSRLMWRHAERLRTTIAICKTYEIFEKSKHYNTLDFKPASYMNSLTFTDFDFQIRFIVFHSCDLNLYETSMLFFAGSIAGWCLWPGRGIFRSRCDGWSQLWAPHVFGISS